MPGSSASTEESEPHRAERAAVLNKWRWLRLALLAVGMASLLAGLWGGLVRLGLTLPAVIPSLVEFHGALMIGGFLGTVISLERAVAIGRLWAYAAPVLSAVAAIALISGGPELSAVLFLLAGVGLTFNSSSVVARQPALFTLILTIGSACWVGGTAAWILDAQAADTTGWWLAFLVLTVAAERLELSRLLAPPRSSQVIFIVAIVFIIVGVARGELAADAAPFLGFGLLAATIWLIKHDIALRTIRLRVQPRFTAACLLAGYFWLGIAAIILLVAPPGTNGLSYDASVHAITIGFILSMIFGHAPIILPAVASLRIRYSSMAYAPLALLHLSVLIRIGADLSGQHELRALSGPVTIVALASYAGVLAIASRKNKGNRPQ